MNTYIFCSLLIFIFGAMGMLLIRRSIIQVLLSLELLLVSININFAVASVFLDDVLGQIFSLMVLAVAASESALGLAILIVYYRLRGGISIELIHLLKS